MVSCVEVPAVAGIYMVTLLNEEPISVNRQDPRIAQKAIRVRRGHIKVGKAKNLAGRRRNYQKTFNAENVEFWPILTCKDADLADLERALKDRFRPFRIRGRTGRLNEWMENVSSQTVVATIWEVVRTQGVSHQPVLSNFHAKGQADDL